MSISWANFIYFNVLSFFTGCLNLVKYNRLVDCDVIGLWIVCCSCVSYDDERSYSFSLFMVLPMWFYMIRFFKEKTFLVLAATAFYLGEYSTCFWMK